MTPCEEYEDLVSAFIDGTLAEEDRGRLMEHMAECPACQAYFDDQIAIHDALLQEAEPLPPADLTAAVMGRVRAKKRARPHWRRWAAAAACCGLVALGLWQFHRMQWERAAEEFPPDARVTADASAPETFAARGMDAPTPEPEEPEAAPERAALDGSDSVAAYSLPTPAANAEMSSSPATASPSLFETLPECFQFSSGAGAWRTELRIASDGSFTGAYTDTNAGGEDPEQYYCNFSGKFSEPVQVDEFTWSVQVESLEVEDTETTSVKADGLNRIASTPYGLENAKEVLIYLPGAAVEDLPESFRNWTHAPETGTLGFYGLYNVEEALGFSEYHPES